MSHHYLRHRLTATVLNKKLHEFRLSLGTYLSTAFFVAALANYSRIRISMEDRIESTGSHEETGRSHWVNRPVADKNRPGLRRSNHFAPPKMHPDKGLIWLMLVFEVGWHASICYWSQFISARKISQRNKCTRILRLLQFILHLRTFIWNGWYVYCHQTRAWCGTDQRTSPSHRVPPKFIRLSMLLVNADLETVVPTILLEPLWWIREVLHCNGMSTNPRTLHLTCVHTCSRNDSIPGHCMDTKECLEVDSKDSTTVKIEPDFYCAGPSWKDWQNRSTCMHTEPMKLNTELKRLLAPLQARHNMFMIYQNPLFRHREGEG